MGVLGIPIVGRGGAVGSLAAVNYASIRALDDHLCDVLTTLCSQVGLYLENARLFADLQTQTGRLAAVLDSQADGMVVIDPDGNVIMTNPRFQAMFSTGGELDVNAHQRLIHRLQRTLEDRERANLIFTLAHPASDTPTVLEVYAAQVRFEEELVGVVASLRDVTVLRSIDRGQHEILKLARHEIGTPLDAIVAWVDLLLSPMSRIPDEKRASILRQIAQQAREVNTVVDETFKYSELQGVVLTRDHTLVPLSQLAEDLAQENLILGAQRELLFISEIEPDLWVMGNYTALKQAFRNLLDNARKFTPAGGTVSWRVYQEGSRIHAQVIDDGIGIPSDQIDQLFQPYYRTRVAQQVEGVGLGLFVVQKVVDAHRGKIVAESVEDEGACFSVTLLAARAPFSSEE